MATDPKVFIFSLLEEGLEIAQRMNLHNYRIICHPDHIAPHRDGTLYVPIRHVEQFIWPFIKHVAVEKNFSIIYLQT